MKEEIVQLKRLIETYKSHSIQDNYSEIILQLNECTQKNLGFVEKKVQNIKEFVGKDILNKVKNVIMFNKLSYNDIYSILKKEINSVNSEFKKKNIHIRISNKELNNLIMKTNYLDSGAREMDKVISDYVDSYITIKKLYS